MGEFHTFLQIMQEKALFSGEIYIAGKDFARPPVLTVATSVWHDLWCNGHPRIQTSAKSQNCISNVIWESNHFLMDLVPSLFCLFKTQFCVECTFSALLRLECCDPGGWRCQLCTCLLCLIEILKLNFGQDIQAEVELWVKNWGLKILKLLGQNFDGADD